MVESPISLYQHGGAAAPDESNRYDVSAEADESRHDPLVAELTASRHRSALTLAQLAERCELPEAALGRWERGDASPTLDAMQRWAAGLGMSLELVRSESTTSSAYSLDWGSRRLTVHGKPVRLTRMEWNILERLAWTPGELVTHRDLFRHLYGEDREDRAQATAIRVRISKLRQKVPFRIEARWGQGYVVDGVEAPPRRSPTDDFGEIEKARACPAPQRKPEGCARNVAFERHDVRFADRLTERPRAAAAAQALRIEEPVKRMAPPPPMPTSSAVRAAELGVIEQFLAERGATRCPDPGMLAEAAVPALVWDKIKRKWVRPAAEACEMGLTQ